MINWKNHKAAFTGASKYLIKGIISVVHSVTSAAVIPPAAGAISGTFRIDFPAEDRDIDFPFESRNIDFPPVDRNIDFPP